MNEVRRESRTLFSFIYWLLHIVTGDCDSPVDGFDDVFFSDPLVRLNARQSKIKFSFKKLFDKVRIK